MSRIAETPRRTLVTSIVLLALLPAAVAANEARPASVLDESARTAVTSQDRASVAASGLLVWAWRAVSADSLAAKPLPVSRFAPQFSSDVAPMEPERMFDFSAERAADRGRVHHSGNLLRIKF